MCVRQLVRLDCLLNIMGQDQGPLMLGLRQQLLKVVAADQQTSIGRVGLTTLSL